MTTTDSSGNVHAPAGTTDGGQFSTQHKAEPDTLARTTVDPLAAGNRIVDEIELYAAHLPPEVAAILIWDITGGDDTTRREIAYRDQDNGHALLDQSESSEITKTAVARIAELAEGITCPLKDLADRGEIDERTSDYRTGDFVLLRLEIER
jgi:hypothetical protein